MVTSSAVVGSSAISSFGLQAIAMAIITRWLMPPESWCGKAREPPLRIGDADRVEQLDRRARARSARSRPRCVFSASPIWKPTVKHGLRRDIGSWKIIAMSLPMIRRRCARRSAPSRSRAVEGQAVGGDRRRPRQQAHHRQHRHRLARAGFADDRQHLAGSTDEVDAVDRVERAVRGWRTRRRGCGSRGAASPSASASSSDRARRAGRRRSG